MKKRKIKEKIALHPVMTFIVFIVIVILLSGLLSLFNFSFTYNKINPTRLDYVSTTESVESLLSLRGVKYIFANTVANFANFTALSHLIIVLLGIGVMEYSGFLKTSVGLLTRKAKKKTITYFIILICLLASIMGDLPYIAFIPISALVFKYGKRNPSIGIIASFAALTCGSGISLFFTSVDSSLANLTTISASILDSTFTFNQFSLILIMAITIIIVSAIITAITEGIIAKKVPKYDFEDTDVLEEFTPTKNQLRGLILAGIGSFIYLLIFIYNIIPGLPFSGNFLNYSEAIYIDKLFGVNSFFSNGFVFIITILFIIWGLLYGIGAKTIKNNREFVESLGHSLNGIGKILVLLFAGATFISVFKYSNIGAVIVAGFTSLISGASFTGLALVILLFLGVVVTTIFMPTSVAKWSIMSSQIVPTMLNAGVSAEFTQLIFRFGECVTLGLTPLFAYFIIYLAYLERYNQNEKSLGLFTALKYQASYSIIIGLILLVIIILWYIISIPLGFNGYVAI